MNGVVERLEVGINRSDTSRDPSEISPLPLERAIRALLACSWRTLVLIVQRRLRQPKDNVGRHIGFADGTRAEVYRETVIDRGPATEPVVLVVGFRLRRVRSEWAHRLFRIESELNTVLFAGFPGLVSKLWLRHDQNGVYRGFYQWDGADQAVAYVRALWWALALVSERASIRYAVLPGVGRDMVLAHPTAIDTLPGTPGEWWRPCVATTRFCSTPLPNEGRVQSVGRGLPTSPTR